MTLIKSILIYRSSSAISGNTLQEVLTLGNDGGGLQIKNIADPTAAQDAATKSYVDAIASGIVTSWKAPVKAATTANITLSGAQTIDGISIIAGDRVLVKDQTTGSENGIYVCAAGAWARSTDADTASEVEGMALTVQQGTSNADTTWLQTADNVTLGTTSLVFTQIGASVPDATSSVKGKAKLYSDLSASNTDGSVTQAGIKTVTDAKASLASPTFTGTPAAPTAAPSTNTTQLATTEFVTTADNLKKNIANSSPTTVTTSGSLTINGVSGSLLTLDCGNKEESKFKFVGDTTPLSIDVTNFPEGAYCILTIERTTNVNVSIRFKNKTYLLSNTQLIDNGKDALVCRGRSSGRTIAVLGFYSAGEVGAQDNQSSPATTNLCNQLKFVEDTEL